MYVTESYWWYRKVGHIYSYKAQQGSHSNCSSPRWNVEASCPQPTSIYPRDIKIARILCVSHGTTKEAAAPIRTLVITMATASSQGSEYPSPQESPRTSPSPSISLPSNAPKAATEDSGSGPVVGLGTASPVPELNDAGTRSARRERELPRDERGRPFCDHPDCQPSKPTFVRRCEWK